MSHMFENSELYEQILAIRRFNRFYTGVIGLLNEMYMGAPIGLKEARVIFEIHQTPGCRACDLVKMLNMDRGYVSRIITRLEKIGFITRKPSPVDGRVLCLYTTKTGGALMDELIQRVDNQLGEKLSRLTPPEREELIQAMERIQELMGDMQPNDS
jgi:DNA-binding MarR family transcriptional regulator